MGRSDCRTARLPHCHTARLPVVDVVDDDDGGLPIVDDVDVDVVDDNDDELPVVDDEDDDDDDSR